ncbi:MAG: hypothetical protein ACRDL7_08840 [Gaiellaceae bacterium]
MVRRRLSSSKASSAAGVSAKSSGSPRVASVRGAATWLWPSTILR